MNLFSEELKTRFALPDFRRGQREIIHSVLEGRDVLAVLPTGGGKSLCFQFPAIHQNKLVIVISPLIALMKDQVAHLKKLNIGAGCLYSGQSEEEKIQVFREIQSGGAFVLYLSPERAQKEGFHRWVQKQNLALFAIDEAHCVSQWGHDFRAEYSQLNILKELRPDVPVLALTASATPTVLDDIARQLRLHKPERHIHGFYRPNLYYQVESCTDEETKLSWLLQSMKQFPTGRILIYCGTRRYTEEIAAFLQKHFDGVGFYHAGMKNADRHETQAAYEKGQLRILAATNAFGMGIDHPDVRLVVHYQMPGNIDSLYQEMGRAGRDSGDSTCLMLYARKDKGLQSFFIQQSEASSEIKRLRYRNLDALVNYAEGGECRHAEILTYYRDAQRLERCGHCDTCDPRSARRVQKPIGKPVTSAVKVKKRRPDAASPDQVLDLEQGLRLEKLKAWRKQKARELDLPAFVVFSDRTLRALAIENPLKLSDLEGIYGLGPAKIERFGTDVIGALHADSFE